VKTSILSRKVFWISLLILNTFLIFENCRNQVITDFEDYPAIPVVNSILVADSTISVFVSMTNKVDASQLEIIENAEVSLFCNNDFKENIVSQGEGIYSSKTIIEVEKNYSCKVSIPGYPLVQCIDSIPAPVAILKISSNSFAGIDEEGISYSSVTFTFTDNPELKNYYEAKIKIAMNNNLSSFPQIINIFDPLLLNEGLPVAVFSDELIEGRSYSMTLNFHNNYYGYSDSSGYYDVPYPLLLEFRSISYNYYQYVKNLYLYESGRYPDIVGGVVTAFPLYSNIENGYGIFAGYSAVVSDTIFPKPIRK
jgi:hypothetical protein